MKKMMFSLLLIYIGFQLFAYELWNGFATDMTEEEVIARANEILLLETPYKLLDKDDYDILPLGMRDYKLPRSDLKVIMLWSNLDGLSKYEIGESSIYKNDKSDYFPNVYLVFYKNRLFAMSINWAANSPDIVNMAIEKYGKPTKMKKYIYVFGEADREIPMWELHGKDFFVHGSEFIFIDQVAQRNFTEELLCIEQQKKIREEEQREKAASQIIF